MGNTQHPQTVVHDRARAAASKFDDEELFMLGKIFSEMSERNSGKG